jgi:hypothetical protein
VIVTSSIRQHWHDQWIGQHQGLATEARYWTGTMLGLLASCDHASSDLLQKQLNTMAKIIIPTVGMQQPYNDAINGCH